MNIAVRGLLFGGLVLMLLGSCNAFRQEAMSRRNQNLAPAYITDPEEQLDYTLRHYWEGVNLKDSIWRERPEDLEAKFVDYFALLSHQEPISIDLALAPLQRLDGALLLDALTIYRRWYYEGDSPFADDEVFRYVVLWAITSPKVPREHQEAARELLKGLNRNRVGKEATNFTYANDTTTVQLFPIREPYRLLVFGTPECNSCREVQLYIARQGIYKRLVEAGKLRVQTVYLQHGGRRDILRPDTLLPEWIERSYDPSDSIIGHRLYDIKSSPTLYLLGEGNKVLLRDPKPEKLTKYLQDNEKN